LHCCYTLPIPDDLEILQVGVSIEFKFRVNFKTELAVLPPGNNVAAILDDAIANAMSFLIELMAESILSKRFYQYHLVHPKRRFLQWSYRQNTLSYHKCLFA